MTFVEIGTLRTKTDGQENTINFMLNFFICLDLCEIKVNAND